MAQMRRGNGMGLWRGSSKGQKVLNTVFSRTHFFRPVKQGIQAHGPVEFADNARERKDRRVS